MKKVIFDIETKNTFDDAQSNDPADLDVSVVCLYDSDSNQYLSFLEDQFDQMWPYFEQADLIVTYNGKHFDLPCLQPHAPLDLSAIKHVDMFEKMQQVTGKKLPLNGIAQSTLGIAKSGHGLDAIAWWNSGEIQKIIDYCIQDVKVTEAVYNHALQNGELKYEDRKTKKEVVVKLDTSDWETIEKPAQGGLF